MAYNNNFFQRTRSARYTAAVPSSSSRYAAPGPSSSRYRSATAGGKEYTPFMPLTGGAALGLSANYSPPRASLGTQGLILPRALIAPVRTQAGRPERRRALATHEGSPSGAEGQKHTHLSAYEYREGTYQSSSPSNTTRISPDRIGSPWRCPHLPPIGRVLLRSPQSQDDYGLGDCTIGSQAGDGADAPAAGPSSSSAGPIINEAAARAAPPTHEGRQQRGPSPRVRAALEHSRALRWGHYLCGIVGVFLLGMIFGISISYTAINPVGLAVKAGLHSHYLPEGYAPSCVTHDTTQKAALDHLSEKDNKMTALWSGASEHLERLRKEVETAEDMEKLVNSIRAMQKGEYAVSGALRMDLASELEGARVLGHLTTHDSYWGGYYGVKPKGEGFGSRLAALFRSPVTGSRSKDLVHDSPEDVDAHAPGWALRPVKGIGGGWIVPSRKVAHLAIQLSRPDRIGSFSIDHISRELVPDRSDAPQDVELWGRVDPKDEVAMIRLRQWRDEERAAWDAEGTGEPQPVPPTEDWVLLGTMKYDAFRDAEGGGVAKGVFSDVQTVNVKPIVKRLEVDFYRVEFRFKRNHGAPMTHVYRVRVHPELGR
ncbi:unnamed protein product [Tilletia caries]|uniref:SUN domain-containing protein n=1 Tax=Tilletia controversa TaxID=13291 RepID=A0A8X7MNJ5_9BASI|nr:hypothetical protein A4X06_0g7235 [Tilletia controversa]CAD6893584.1 unnamed protein product [Tilletia caries]CAD6918407.1 unnamed protein product [Tilletia caries]CAD7063301.1 unnamed protein product [Tilletia caries]